MCKNCPFCDSLQVTIDTLNCQPIGKPFRYRVQCQECGACTRWHETEEAAWEAWNARPSDRVPEHIADRLSRTTENLKEGSKNLLAFAEKGKAKGKVKR